MIFIINIKMEKNINKLDYLRFADNKDIKNIIQDGKITFEYYLNNT